MLARTTSAEREYHETVTYFVILKSFLSVEDLDNDPHSNFGS